MCSPKIFDLVVLTGSILGDRGVPFEGMVGACFFVSKYATVLAETIQEAIASNLDQKGPQLVYIGEFPIRLAKAFQEVAPRGLHNVERIEFGPQLGR